MACAVVGAGTFKRIAINAAIKFASLFTKNKVINRIYFGQMSELIEEVPQASLPAYVEGGNGGAGGIDDLTEVNLSLN